MLGYEINTKEPKAKKVRKKKVLRHTKHWRRGISETDPNLSDEMDFTLLFREFMADERTETR
jgi:hypothetical protein